MTVSIHSAAALVVDDHSVMRGIMASILDAIGVELVVKAGSVVDAMRLLRANVFDVVLTDFHMPGPNGLTLIAAIRAMADHPNAHVGIVMVTSQGDMDTVWKARAAGVDSFLVKPISAESVARHVSAAIALTRTRRAKANEWRIDD